MKAVIPGGGRKAASPAVVVSFSDDSHASASQRHNLPLRVRVRAMHQI